MKKRILMLMVVFSVLVCFLSGCKLDGTQQDTLIQVEVGSKLQENQSTPTDINYSLERYNLIRRAYWVNGQREKANSLVCQIDKPLGYVVLFSGNTVVGRFVVDGKITSLNSFLTSNYQYFTTSGVALSVPREMPDVDGSYGENDTGIFFFTPDGKYIEWTGEYLYSDVPFEVENPVVTYEEQ